MNELSNRDIPLNIEDIMHTAYLQYALSVNVGRAIPDVRDGLKPVTRRILYAMNRMGLTKSHATMKCARVVGEVMGKYHPHGDSAIYDALVRLAQDFSMGDTLIEGQGNFGTIDGDPAAAARYTECRMERLAEELLADIDKETVDMMQNFDETELEPTVLPAKFPNLLVNGTTGIGVGMATNIPTHNLGEVIDATVALLDNPQATVDELMTHLPGPDFPTGAIIRGRAALRNLYQTGSGSVRIRARAEIVEKNGHEQIIITEIPYGINKAQEVAHLAQLIRDKVIVGITSFKDTSSKRAGGISIVIEVARGAMAQVVLNQIYTHTLFETTFGCTMLVVDHNRPRTMNLVQILQAYIDHRLEVVVRRSIFELRKAEDRIHILQGYLKALDFIDEVIEIIRKSANRQEAGEKLMARLDLSQLQVNAILDMRLHQLTNLARETLQNEFNELQAKVAYLNAILASRQRQLEVIREELIAIRERYATPRRTEIVFDDSDLNVADLIPRHNCVITVSDTGYIKRVPADTYQTRHRGGLGVIGMETREEDHVAHLFNAHSHDLIFFFTDRGFMYWLNVYEIPEGARTGKGKAIINMIKIEQGEKICAMLTVTPEQLDDTGNYIVLASRNGYIKKSELSLFRNLRRVGLRALVIEEDDTLIGAGLSRNGDEILLSTKRGMACRFEQNDEQIRPMGRSARGVTGMRFKLEGDEVVSMEIVREPTYDEAESVTIADEAAEDAAEAEAVGNAEAEAEVEVADDFSVGPEVLVVTDGGMGKRSCVSTYRKTNRGARGVVNIRLRDGENVLTVIQVTGDDEVLLTTERGQLMRIPVAEIRRVGRNSKGVKIMNLRSGDRITGAAKMIREPENAAGEENGAEAPEAEGGALPVENSVTTVVPAEGSAPAPEENSGNAESPVSQN